MALKEGITSSTPDRIELGPGILYANYENGTGTAIGATLGGGSFNLNRTKRYIMPDGAKGKMKGLGFVELVEATLQMNVLEVTKDNLVKFIAAANETAFSSAEAVGTGDGTTTIFALDASSDGVIEKVFIDGTEQTSGWTITGTSLAFTTAPTSGSVVTADYTYAGTPEDGDFYRLTGDTTIATADYLTNLALVLEYTGDATDGAILILDNPLAVGGFTLAIPTGQQEVIYPITWEAHFTAGSETTEPWQYLLPYNA